MRGRRYSEILTELAKLRAALEGGTRSREDRQHLRAWR